MSAEPGAERAPYPPPGHFLRHLRLVVDLGTPGLATGSMPVLPDLCDPAGAVRLGPVAAFVDYVAGALASAAAAPDWIVTHDLEVHLLGEARDGILTARCRHVREARNHFVSEAEVVDGGGLPVAHVFITYTRLHGSGEQRPHRPGAPARHNLAEVREAPRVPIDDFLGFHVEPPGRLLRFDHLPVLRNSTGAIQGGVIATAFEALATAMAAERTGSPARATDLHLYYLNQGRRPPFEARGRVLRALPGGLHARFELAEAASPDRPLAIGTASASAL